MNREFVLSLSLMGIVLVSGCGNPQAARLGSGGDAVTMETHQAIFNPETFGGVQYAVQMGDLGSARNTAATPEFKERVEAFAQSGLPAEWKGREAAKEELVQALRDLVAAAESGGDIRTAVENVAAANQKLTATSQ